MQGQGQDPTPPATTTAQESQAASPPPQAVPVTIKTHVVETRGSSEGLRFAGSVITGGATQLNTAATAAINAALPTATPAQELAALNAAFGAWNTAWQNFQTALSRYCVLDERSSIAERRQLNGALHGAHGALNLAAQAAGLDLIGQQFMPASSDEVPKNSAACRLLSPP